MNDYPNERDCEHGALRRSCEVCELKKELAEARRALKWLSNYHSDGAWPRWVCEECIVAVGDGEGEK